MVGKPQASKEHESNDEWKDIMKMRIDGITAVLWTKKCGENEEKDRGLKIIKYLIIL